MGVLKQGGKIHQGGTRGEDLTCSHLWQNYAILSKEEVVEEKEEEEKKELDDINQVKDPSPPSRPPGPPGALGAETQTKWRLMEVQRQIYFNLFALNKQDFNKTSLFVEVTR